MWRVVLRLISFIAKQLRQRNQRSWQSEKHSCYNFTSVLGKGHFGEVFQVKKCREQYVCKAIKCQTMREVGQAVKEDTTLIKVQHKQSSSKSMSLPWKGPPSPRLLHTDRTVRQYTIGVSHQKRSGATGVHPTTPIRVVQSTQRSCCVPAQEMAWFIGT